jgi:hypothetical protein
LTTLGFQIKAVAGNLLFPDWYLSAVTAFFFLSLGVNALVTALIVYKIIAVYHDIQGFNAQNVQAIAHGLGKRDLYPLASILMESGIMTFAGQLAQSIMYKSATAAFPLVGGCVVMLYVWAFLVDLVFYLLISSSTFFTQGISMTAVLVRVERGVSYDHNTSKTANSMRPSAMKT